MKSAPPMSSRATVAVLPKTRFARGLEARGLWQAALDDHDAVVRATHQTNARTKAGDQGYIDFYAGRPLSDLPPLLADIPDLLVEWARGWRCGEEDACGSTAANDSPDEAPWRDVARTFPDADCS